MTRGRALLAVFLLAAAAGPSCSKDPTLVNIVVSSEGTLPPVSIMRVTLEQASTRSSNLFRSLLRDTDSGVEPFQFPAPVEFNFAGAAASPATITVEALDDLPDYPVLASGQSTVDVKPHATVTAEVVLTGSPSPPSAGPGDGGEPVDGGVSPAAPGSSGDASAPSDAEEPNDAAHAAEPDDAMESTDAPGEDDIAEPADADADADLPAP